MMIKVITLTVIIVIVVLKLRWMMRPIHLYLGVSCFRMWMKIWNIFIFRTGVVNKYQHTNRATTQWYEATLTYTEHSNNNTVVSPLNFVSSSSTFLYFFLPFSFPLSPWQPYFPDFTCLLASMILAVIQYRYLKRLATQVHLDCLRRSDQDKLLKQRGCHLKKLSHVSLTCSLSPLRVNPLLLPLPPQPQFLLLPVGHQISVSPWLILQQAQETAWLTPGLQDFDDQSLYSPQHGHPVAGGPMGPPYGSGGPQSRKALPCFICWMARPHAELVWRWTPAGYSSSRGLAIYMHSRLEWYHCHRVGRPWACWLLPLPWPYGSHQ